MPSLLLIGSGGAESTFREMWTGSVFGIFFAIHETEAWLLSQPEIFPDDVRSVLPTGIAAPEQVNFDEPPGYLLNRLYKQTRRKKYKKVVYGGQLFEKLDPSIAYAKCPMLKALLDEMLAMARAAGLGSTPGQGV